MADPEIGLADSYNSDNRAGSDEKTEVAIEGTTTKVDVSTGKLDSDTEINYHYLTFETPLPIPTNVYSGPENGENRPPRLEQPDLKKFTSPFLWPEARKRYTIYVSCIATCITAYTAGSYSQAANRMSEEWGVSEVAILVGITTFCTGFGIAPMVLAPLSEINGRYPVFIASGILYVVCQICCAVTRSYPGMLVARFFTGCGSSTFSTMVGGVVSDLYHAEGRNTPMALFAAGALIGTGLGPLVSGFIAQYTTWRWVFWVQVITNGTLVMVIALTFKETRGSILLSRKARALNAYYEKLEAQGYYGVQMENPISNEVKNEKDATSEKYADLYQSDNPVSAAPTIGEADGSSEKAKEISIPRNEESPPRYSTSRTQTQRIRWLVKSDEERASLSQMIKISLFRPFHLLITEPVVFFFSLWVSFAWAVLYLTFGSIPLVFSTTHGFTVSQTGAIFSAMSIAAILSTILSIYQEKLLLFYAENYGWTKILKGLKTPERRLYFACVESVLLPIGLFWFGWTQFSNIPWIVPTLGIGCATMGIYSVYLATFNYLADTYHRYASSALAAQSFCRNILGGIFPLITAALFNNLGFANAASLLGAIGAVLTVVPWVLVFWGEWIRGRSKFASEIMHG